MYKKKLCLLALTILSLFGGISSCNEKSESADFSPTEIYPELFIATQDRSGTFKNYPLLTTEQMIDLANHLNDSGKGGMLAFAFIGNPTDQALLRCPIKPLPPLDEDASLGERVKRQDERNAVHAMNVSTIRKKAKAYKHLLEIKNEKYTDLNGTVSKIKQLLQEPQFENYHKRLLMYSDGKHHVGSNKKLDCSFEEIDNLEFLTIGWKNQNTCKSNIVESFESLEGFITYYFSKI